ncbi:hypothetical protein [Rhodopirellula baltica]
MINSVEPFKGIGDFRLGAKREIIREQACGQFEPFKPNVDAFDDAGVHCHYDETNTVVFIESFEPSPPAIKGTKVLGRPLSEVLRDLESKGFDFNEALTESIFPKAGLAFYIDDEGLIASVAVFQENYYEKLNH